ncbi:hypothetical protein JOC95_003448 [Bacillus tianshenii]|uniref:Uncharacterized protein n=1 Tax=Sutcliffiella tianshenii TaxID=1463404 RepID=A0ABS2P3W1_9BACI|nr:hypothetical protein [Bacillus tianshenii]
MAPLVCILKLASFFYPIDRVWIYESKYAT